MEISRQLLLLSIATCCILAAPVPSPEPRQAKSLSFYDEDEPVDFEPETDDYVLDENEISRSVAGRRRKPPAYNSPVYYIRLPPQPYMFVPGLGYVSQPAPNAISQFVNVPVSFVANGKPSAIYQWGGALDAFPTAPPRPKPVPKPAESQVHRLPGKYTFNGKPNDIFVLRDSYNSLYSDALQNFYP